MNMRASSGVRAVWILSVSSLGLGLGACQSPGLGKVPTSWVDLYDQASPDGVIEIELERSGEVLEIEADIPVESLPTHIRDAALGTGRGAVITGAEREMQQGGTYWEVKLERNGRAFEYVLDDAGTIRESEEELERSEAPAAVLAAADQVIEGGTFKSVEVIRRSGHEEYHVKKVRDGASYKIVLAADGTVLRAVREARAEIEVPLKLER